jgi:hypothetical protein
MISNAEIEERMRRGMSKQNGDPMLGHEYNLRQMRMILDQASIEGCARKLMKGDVMDYETTTKLVPKQNRLKRWARILRTP